MAEDDKSENAEQGEEQAPSSKKKLIIIGGLVVLVLAIAGGVMFFLMGGDDAADGEEEVVEEVIAPAIYLNLEPPVLSTFTIDGRQRYMQVSISVMARDQASLDAVEYHMPSIRSRLNRLYGGADFKMAQTNEGKQALREETVKAINAVLEGEGEPPIEAVFFTNFVMQ